MTTTKILDTTVISACINTIVKVNLLEICSMQYRVATSRSVRDELSSGFPGNVTEGIFRFVSVESDYDEQQYRHIISYLQNRYPYLGDGELSIVVVALLAYDLKEVPSFVVTDDLRFKKRFREILEAPQVVKSLGGEKSSIQVAGTIGLVRQLFRRGRIPPEILRTIISDLRNGTLYITDKLIDELKECLE